MNPTKQCRQHKPFKSSSKKIVLLLCVMMTDNLISTLTCINLMNLCIESKPMQLFKKLSGTFGVFQSTDKSRLNCRHRCQKLNGCWLPNQLRCFLSQQIVLRNKNTEEECRQIHSQNAFCLRIDNKYVFEAQASIFVAQYRLTGMRHRI